MVRNVFTLSGLVLLLILGWNVFSNNSIKEPDAKSVFTADEIVWYGLDFREAHFVGPFDQGFGIEPARPAELAIKWIPAWNELVLAERDNFNLGYTFRKRFVVYDLKSVTELNAHINADNLISNNEKIISDTRIREMVPDYKSYEKKDGLGLVFIIDNFNKYSKLAGMHVCFFDIATKKILLNEYIYGKPSGFGLRNYWAGAIKDVLSQISFYEYIRWKNKYYSHPQSQGKMKQINDVKEEPL